MSRDIEVGDKVVRKSDGTVVYDVRSVVGKFLWISREGENRPWTVDLDRYELAPELPQPRWEEGAVYNHPFDEHVFGKPIDYYCIHVDDQGRGMLAWFSPTWSRISTETRLASSVAGHNLKEKKSEKDA